MVSGGRLRGRVVVVVDDSPELVDTFVQALEHEGASAIGCLAPEEALEVASSRAIDALVVDLRMTRIDGQELIRRVRALPGTNASARAIAITGDELWRYRDPASSTEAGFDYHFVKPVPLGALVDVLEHLLPRAKHSRHPAGRTGEHALEAQPPARKSRKRRT
jgi:two-component system CheB/CheR fusion protein